MKKKTLINNNNKKQHGRDNWLVMGIQTYVGVKLRLLLNLNTLCLHIKQNSKGILKVY